jgi:hypothetical protein
VEEKNEEVWKGYFYAGLLFCSSVLQTLFLAHYFQRMNIIAMRLRSTLTSVLYRKVLAMSNSARKGMHKHKY